MKKTTVLLAIAALISTVGSVYADPTPPPPSAVPEPSTYIAGALMLVPFATSAVQKMRARKNEKRDNTKI